MYENLIYRRQFILSITSDVPLPGWNCLHFDNYYLYSHSDLPVTQLTDSKKRIILIGEIYDSTSPEKQNEDILKDIANHVNHTIELFLYIKRYAGCYVLIYKDKDSFVIFNDPLGLRELYYCNHNNSVICGSQPNLITYFSCPQIAPSHDSLLLDFFNNHINHNYMIGDETYFEYVKHLLPNHYLDIFNNETQRYWPIEPIQRLNLDEAVSKSCTFLQGILKAMVFRHSVMMAVTAGIDSRTLLAASKDLKNKIYYFINDENLGPHHPDISVSTRIFKSINIPFHVHPVSTDVDEEFSRIFFSNVFFAARRILPTIYNVYYRYHSNKVNVVGAGELGRNRFGEQPNKITSHRIAHKFGYIHSAYGIKQSKKILSELLPISMNFGINIMTLLYWEQSNGNRWVTTNSESDIAIEEVDAFDSHLIYEYFLGVDKKYCKYRKNVFLKEMIRTMWPELLGWPINPPYGMKDKFKHFLEQIYIYPLLKEFQYKTKYALNAIKKRAE